MDRAMTEQLKSTLQTLEKEVADRIRRRRGPAAVASLAGRIAGMDTTSGHEAAVRRLGPNAALLVRIRAALERARLGTLGSCLLCRKPIGQSHMRAVPWAAFCLRCRQEVDSREGDLTVNC